MHRAIAVAVAVLLVVGSGALATSHFEDDGFEDHGTYERDGDTFAGDHVAFELDEERPGVTDYRILPENDSVFASVSLPGSDVHWSIHDEHFIMDSGEAQLMIQDNETYRISVDVDTDGEAALSVADGVEVAENATWSDHDDRIYDVSAGAHDLKIGGENLTYDNGTFTADDDVMFGGDFPGEPEGFEDKRFPREDYRERESQWDRDGDDFQGEHVRFTKDEALPGVTDVGPVGPDLTILDQVELPGDDPEWQAHGRMFAMGTAHAHLEVVDVPPAVLHLEVRGNATVTLTLADGVTAQEVPVEDDDAPEGASIYKLVLPGNRTAWLGGLDVVHEAPNGSEERLEVGEMAHARLAPGDDPRPHDGDGDAEPGPSELGPEERQRLDRAAASGKVGVEVHPSDGNATVVELGHVTVRKTQRPGGDVRAGVTVEAPDGSPGTVVRFTLDASALEGIPLADAPDVLTVRFDNESIEAADDLEDALEWDDDGGEPEYLLLVGGEAVEVLVSVPHFSPHTIEVVESASSGDGDVAGAPGPGVVAAVLAGVAAAAIRRR